MPCTEYRTRGGFRIHRHSDEQPYEAGAARLTQALDTRRGVLLSSGFEFTGRYTRWDLGFVDPPLAITARGRRFAVEALNERGRVLMGGIAAQLSGEPHVRTLDATPDRLEGEVHEPDGRLSEEMRSRQPSVFSVLRSLVDLFAAPDDPHGGLYGAFGYDLVFQFEPMQLSLARPDDSRDLLLYLPDEILVVDHAARQASLHRYEFESPDGATTEGLARHGACHPYRPGDGSAVATTSHGPGEFAASVEQARALFARGDLFEAVLGQVFAEPCADAPSRVFDRLRRANPAPYGALINLGEGEFLVAASPEMFVRVEGRRIETCPISGTIARGRDAVEDAERIRELLNSAKDEAELTMCTDVDRNDKSRVCEPGSVKVVGRRQLELYSRLIHTVDHVEGMLRPEYDALDGFLTHAWAVTVTGAPKRWAIRFIEETERSARRWYGGAIGRMTFDGNMNTGLTIRTVRMKDGIAEVRAGATLLHDSDPAAEDDECRLKASALLAAIRTPQPSAGLPLSEARPARRATRVLLVDHEDSFVHTLADYARQAGGEVVTLRAEAARAELAGGARPDLLLLSPGPGRPADFAMSATLDLAVRAALPVFGVCLGLQGIVEHFGGDLDVLERPVHGRASLVRLSGGRLFAGLPASFPVGRYHSLHARRATLPGELTVTAETDDGVVMAVEHRDLPIAAVQFHPESILTSPDAIGLPLIEAVLSRLTLRAVSSSGARRTRRWDPPGPDPR
jgi:anthranilate synthase